MIHELRTYTIAPGRIAEFVELTGTVGRRIRGDRYGTLLGYWKTLHGTLGQVVHLWEYPEPNERMRLRTAMMQDTEWIGDYVPKSLPLVVEQTNLLLLPAEWHDMRAVSGKAIYDLRTHHLQPGKVAEWMRFRRTVEAHGRSGVLAGVWTAETGPLNSVLELWGYEDANAWHRAGTESASTLEPDAMEARLNALTRRTQSVLLAPSEFSPLR